MLYSISRSIDSFLIFGKMASVVTELDLPLGISLLFRQNTTIYASYEEILHILPQDKF